MLRMVNEGRGQVPREAHEEGLRVARLLARRIEAAGFSVRKVEEKVGWGQKTLQQVLNGEQPIRVSHVAAVFSALGLELDEFYRELAESTASRAGKRQKSGDRGGPAQPTARPPRTMEELLKEVRDYHLARALLERCQNLRWQDAEGMVLAASMATSLAAGLKNGPEGPEALADLQAWAWAELGNAYRASEDLISPGGAFARALDLAGQGTGDPLLLARIMDLTASLFSAQRRFAEAHRLIDWVYAIHQRSGDSHSAARALISKATFFSFAYEPEKAMPLLQRGISLIDGALDPQLTVSAVHTLLLNLAHSGYAAEVKRMLPLVRDLYEAFALFKPRFRQLEGQVAAAQGEDGRAEQAFLESREALQRAGLPFTAAYASFDLAAVWLRQGKTAKLKKLVDEMVGIFRSLDIRREATGALLMLKEALQKDQASAALLHTAAAEFRRSVGFRA